MIDFRTLTLNQVEQLFVDSGYDCDEDYHAFTRENDLFKYIGVNNGAARYLIGYEDDNEEDKWFASIMYVTIGAGGKLVADYGGCPEFETDDLDVLTKYFEDRCN